MNYPIHSGDASLYPSDIAAVAHRLGVKMHDRAASYLSNNPTMEGMILGVEVQRDLFATGYQVRYLKDLSLEETIGPTLLCGLHLSGEMPDMTVVGLGTITFEKNRSFLISLPNGGRCRTTCEAGRSGAVAGFALRRGFLDRFSNLSGEQEFIGLAALFEGAFSINQFPASSALFRIAGKMLDPEYTGALEQLYLESCTLAFVAETVRLLEDVETRPADMTRRHYDQVVRARELLDRDIASPPSVEALTKELGVNATTLRINFSKAFGTTIFGHVRNRRLEVARFLLKTHDLSVAEIGYRVGFTNAAAFSTAYRRHFGHSPRHEVGPGNR